MAPFSLSSSMFMVAMVEFPRNSGGGGSLNIADAWPREVSGSMHSNLNSTKLVNTNHYDNDCYKRLENNNVVNKIDKEFLFPTQCLRRKKTRAEEELIAEV